MVLHSIVYEGPDGFAVDDFAQVAILVHIEDIDGQVVVLAHADGGEVHHFQTAAEHFFVSDFVELHGGRVFLRVCRVDTVDASTLQHDVGFNLNTSQ